jgi:hypothetical protein
VKDGGVHRAKWGQADRPHPLRALQFGHFMKVIRSGGVRILGLLGEFLRALSIDRLTWKTSLNGGNRTQAGSLCYINAVASELQVHGDSSLDGSEFSTAFRTLVRFPFSDIRWRSNCDPFPT